MVVSNVDDVERLKKINAALMGRVERSMDQQGNAFSLFQTAINLEHRVRARTEELRSTLRTLEQSNIDLVSAKETAEHANLSKTRFLAAASHDILQPLNAAHLSVSALANIQTTDEGRGAGAAGRALAGDDGGPAAHAAGHLQARRRRGQARDRRRLARPAVHLAALRFPAAGGKEGLAPALPPGAGRGALRPHAAAPHPAEHRLQRGALYPRRRRAGRRQAAPGGLPHRHRRHRRRHSRAGAGSRVRGIPPRPAHRRL